MKLRIKNQKEEDVIEFSMEQTEIGCIKIKANNEEFLYIYPDGSISKYFSRLNQFGFNTDSTSS